MKDGSRKDVYSKIYIDTTLHKNYLELVDKSFKKSDSNRVKKIFADQTFSIARVGINKDIIIGMANDTCWMFKVVNGPISAYSYLANSSSYFDSSAINGIQAGDVAIEPFNEKNLKTMISSDPKAMEQFEKKNYYKALIKYNKNVLKAKKEEKPR